MSFVSLKTKWEKEVMAGMQKKFNLKNKMAVPRIEKTVINIGFGRKVAKMTGKEREKWLSFVTDELSLITGQKPVLTKAKKSIAGFNLRQGAIIGAKVTLRGEKMYSFLDRLINIALPRSRDFRGLKLNSIDKTGNLTIGIQDHAIFPEINVDTLKDSFGFEIIIKSTTTNRDKAVEMFKLLGFPFIRE